MASPALVHLQEPDLVAIAPGSPKPAIATPSPEIVRRYAGVVYAASHRILCDEARGTGRFYRRLFPF